MRREKALLDYKQKLEAENPTVAPQNDDDNESIELDFGSD